MNALVNFTYPPSSTVRSPLLRGTHLVLGLGILVYTLIDLIAFKRYVLYEDVQPIFSTGDPGSAFPISSQTMSTHFCNNSAFDYSGFGMNVSKAECLFLPDTSFLLSIKADEIQAYTLHLVFPEGCRSFACAQPKFIVGTEYPRLVIQHAIYPRSGFYFNPKTTLMKSDGTVFREVTETEHKGLILVTIADFLSMAGITLDEINPFTQDPSTDGSKDAKYRTVGVILIANFEYSNYRAWDMDISARAKVTVKALQGLMGYSGPLSRYFPLKQTDMREAKIGVRILLRGNGQIGQPDGYTTVLRLTSSLVLFGVATAIALKMMRSGYISFTVPEESDDPVMKELQASIREIKQHIGLNGLKKHLPTVMKEVTEQVS